MSSESELREAIHASANNSTKGIDTDAVLRKVRARRVPKQVVFSSLSVLAIAGIATLGITTIPSLHVGPDTTSDAAMTSTMPGPLEGTADGGSNAKSSVGPENTRNLCGSPTNSAPENSAGLTLSVSFPMSSPANGQEVAGTVTLTNNGSSPVSGTTAVIPTVTLSRDGITVWHSDGATISMVVDVELAPGQSSSYNAYFTPVECSPEDDNSGMFRSNLPLLAAGPYEVSANMSFVPSNPEANETILVGGPAQAIELR